MRIKKQKKKKESKGKGEGDSCCYQERVGRAREGEGNHRGREGKRVCCCGNCEE